MHQKKCSVERFWSQRSYCVFGSLVVLYRICSDVPNILVQRVSTGDKLGHCFFAKSNDNLARIVMKLKIVIKATVSIDNFIKATVSIVNFIKATVSIDNSQLLWLRPLTLHHYYRPTHIGVKTLRKRIKIESSIIIIINKLYVRANVWWPRSTLITW